MTPPTGKTMSLQDALAVLADCCHHPDETVLTACEVIMRDHRDTVEARRAAMLHEQIRRFSQC